MQLQNVPEALLLDAGNTLVFLDHDALAEAVREAGLETSGPALLAAEPSAKRSYQRELQAGLSHDRGWYVYMEALFRSAGHDEGSARRGALAARRAHDAFNLWRKVPADLPAALARASAAGIRLAVVSNAEGTIAELLATLGLAQHFELVVDSAIEGVRKPDPEIFRRALARLDVEAARALYAGDIPDVDVAGAQAAGMGAALIDAFDHFTEHRASPRFRSVSELVAALEELTARDGAP